MIVTTLIVLIFFAVLAILLKDNLLSIISLGVVSALLSITFFQLGAPVAGVFELSVGSGLITVLAILTISFIQNKKEKKGKFNPRLPIFILAAVILFFLIQSLIKPDFISSFSPVSWGKVGDILWKTRVFDLLPQILIVLAAVFGIIALLRHEKGEEE
jgi:NADH:ubiquinone oxidoreductase subunit 6 (subunit J)